VSRLPELPEDYWTRQARFKKALAKIKEKLKKDKNART
jgi:hypothetical protein